MLNLKRCAHHFLKTFFWGFLLVFLFIGEVQGNEPRIQLTLEERAWLEAHPEIIIAYDGNFSRWQTNRLQYIEGVVSTIPKRIGAKTDSRN